MRTYGRSIRMLGSAALVALAALRAAPATAEETLLCHVYITTVPYTISAPGHYCLRRNLRTAVTSGNAITIASDSVWLDLNNFTLDGSAAGASTTAFGVRSENHKDVTVRNGTVRGFLYGVELEDDATTNNLTVEGIRADGSTAVGIAVFGPGAGHVIRNNVVTNTGGGTIPFSTGLGIGVGGTGTVMNNDVINTFATPDAIAISLSGGNPTMLLVVGNRVTKSAGFGIFCALAPSGGVEVVLRDNTVTSTPTPYVRCTRVRDTNYP
jgi:hypothetical protein